MDSTRVDGRSDTGFEIRDERRLSFRMIEDRVWSDPAVNRSCALAVYAALVYYDSMRGGAKPTQTGLGRKIGVGRVAVNRAISALVDAGYVRVEHPEGPGKRCLYVLLSAEEGPVSDSIQGVRRLRYTKNDTEERDSSTATAVEGAFDSQTSSSETLTASSQQRVSSTADLAGARAQESEAIDVPVIDRRTGEPLPNPEAVEGEVVDEGSEVARLAALLAASVERRSGKRRAVSPKWIRSIDRTLRLDGVSVEEYEAIVAFVDRDPFWSGVVFSPDNIRKQVTRFAAAVRNGNGSGRGPGGRRTVVEEANARLREFAARKREETS